MRPPLLLLLWAVAWLGPAAAGFGQPQRNAKDAPYTLADELEHLYRIDLLPAYRPHSVVAQVSSYDTTGGNNDGFGGLYSFVRREGDHLVVADLEGPGIVERIWTPTPTEDTLAFYFDGEATPRLRLPFIDLFSGNRYPFVDPVAGHEVGGYYSYVPLPYGRSLKIVFEGERILFHQIQYRRFTDGRRVESYPSEWPAATREAFERVRAVWRGFGRPLSARTVHPGGDVLETGRQLTLRPGETRDLFRSDAGGRIIGLEIEPLNAPPEALQALLLEAVWDGEGGTAIRAPVTDFFGYGFGAPSMQGLLAGVRDGLHYCYLPMPFDREAVLRLSFLQPAGTPHDSLLVRARVLFTDEPRNAEAEGRLYTMWRREIGAEPGTPYLLLDAQGRGHHTGTLLRAQGLNPGMTLFFEGDDVATVDGEMRLHGTGSEDYFNGGWYALLDRWNRGISLPLHGSLDYSVSMARTGGFRFYLADKVSFEQSYHLTIEHGPEGNQIPVDYTSLAFYYGDTPPSSAMDPAAFPAAATAPAVHEYYPQLMNVSLGWGTSLDFSNARDFVVSGGREALLQITLTDVPGGRYRVLLSYYREPGGAPFSLWQRQRPLSDWLPSDGETETLIERQPMGEVEVSDQIDTLTIRVRPGDAARSFRFNRLFLERIDR